MNLDCQQALKSYRVAIPAELAGMPISVIDSGGTLKLVTRDAAPGNNLIVNCSGNGYLTLLFGQGMPLVVKQIDTTSLSNRINTKLNIADTAAMLVPYARKASPIFTGTVTADNVTAKQYSSAIQTLTDGATITWNANTSDQAIVTLSGTGRTLSITNPIAGSFYTLKIIQGNPGGRTITTWPTNTKWPGGIVPTLTTASNAVDIVSFWYDGTNYNAAYKLDVK